MSWHYQEYKKERINEKRKDPIGFKLKFVRKILGQITSDICNRMNYCGWKYKAGSDLEKMDYFYHWKMENFNHRQAYERDIIKSEYNINNAKTRKYVVCLLEEAYILFTEGNMLTHCFGKGEFEYYNSWFLKNIQKFKENRW